MNYLKLFNKIYLILLLVIVVSSCKKQLDVNLSNPNGVTSNQLTGKDLFANTLQITSGNITNRFDFANQWMGYWARTTSYSPSGNQALIERFNLSNSYSDALWQSEYHNIYDYNFIIANSASNSILPGACKIMKAIVFQDLVDVFGNVPYSQAADPNTSTQPKYDDAQTIYRDLIAQIDQGIASIKSSAASSDDVADIMFKGDKAKWVRFANTVKLRILLRQTPKGDQSYVQAEIAKILAEGSGFLNFGEDAAINPGYANVVSQQNPFWGAYGFEVNGSRKSNNIFYIANKTMIDYLTATQDPRLGFLYDTTNGQNTGNYLGDFTQARPVNSLATIGKGILKSAAMSGLILSSSESYFLQSEASFRGLLGSNNDYEGLLKKGIEESFRLLNIPAAAATADTYYSSSTDPRVHIQAGNELQAIIYQKWVALAEIDGLESWSDYRRTGFPDRTNPSVATGVNINKIPKRLLYPQSEYNLNSNNVNAQGQSSSDIYKPLFWAQ